MKAFTYYIDPGHGWLKVSAADCAAVGLSAASFSRYSYQRDDEFFLEEDCDASKFVEAYKAKHGHGPRIVESHSNSASFVRRLPRLNALMSA